MGRCSVQIDPEVSPIHHMGVDALLVESSVPLKGESPILRFYSWPKNGAMTLGRFLKTEELLETSFCKVNNIEFSVRPTGGGLLLHNCEDVSFSLFLPQGHPVISSVPSENYIRLHKVIYDAIEKISDNRLKRTEVYPSLSILPERPMYCMASHTPYDIVMNGKKIGGSACRITKKGLLFQASLFMRPCNWAFFQPCLKNGEKALREMRAVSTSIDELIGIQKRDLPFPSREACISALSVFFQTAIT